MSSRPRHQLQRLLLALCAAAGATQADQADGTGNANGAAATPAYRQECAACHVAYPAGLLSAASWQRLMNNLPRHFGTDASLDPATLKTLSAWLEAYAGTYRRVREPPPEDRITRSAWFIRKHDEVSTATWTLPAVKSAANCPACHTQSEQGDFNERKIRIPR